MIKLVYVFVILGVSFLGEAFSQDSLREQHIEIVSDINCSLSNSWAINLSVNSDKEEGYEANAIKSFLFTYKTKKEGRNSGVILNLYDIAFKDTILIDKAQQYASVAVEFLYTKNYIVYINYGKDADATYDKYVAILLEDLKAFFELNKDNL